MALTLPGITIDDPVKEARVVAAFTDSSGRTPMQNYRLWYRNALIQEVLGREVAGVESTANVERERVRREVASLLDGTA